MDLLHQLEIVTVSGFGIQGVTDGETMDVLSPYMCEAYPLTTTTATTEAPVTTTKTSQTTTGTQLTTAEVLMTTTEAALRTTELLLTTTEAPLTTSDVPLTSAEARMTTTDMSLTREPPFGECKNIFMQFI